MKVIVIGCTHSGTAAVKTIRKTYPYDNIDITVYERNNNVSFLSCGIALYIGGVVQDEKGLFYSNAQELSTLGINMLLEHEVLRINFDQKKIWVKNLQTNEEFSDYFDKLILSTGSWPVIPKINGINSKNLFLCKNFDHAKEIIQYAKKVNNITIVGAGYIGVELAEAFSLQNKKVVLIDAEDRIMSKYLDIEFTTPAQQQFTKHNVQLALGQKVSQFVTQDELVTHVQTDKNTFSTEMVILCISFVPNSSIANNYLKTSPNGAFIVNDFLQTSHPDVYACGDCINVLYNPLMDYKYIPLATNAVKTGTIVGLNIKENRIVFSGVQGTSAIKIYELNIASTGITEYVASQLKLNYDVEIIKDADKPEFMPDYNGVIFKIIFEKDTKKILGGQILSKSNLLEQINTLSLCIQKKMTVNNLFSIDSYFNPHYNKPFSLLQLATLRCLK
ncbi:FAD-dependent oxidoreductase [Candidatus Phytoplasma fabacearum]|uniref:FAD-dependent oxidoreductase n=1 Tax=Candidatus Phytoplasma fabacearum TaxID=2982628 RepID=UPI00271402A3|nr:FAD-dependent oxidoreductase ['Bituminaria bituminosa' little leaf phytoplasma]MDV3148876.1 FAD-dependent oxidoreductase [Pigeon pea little leaf phytoplasma]MDO7983655.1 FAD-dependent oxidoreductase ['Bituminaria bituminosa' little leaf phytoplasma]MDO8030554.1 FAD-dependent oxidoreductase ['Bituminaria bituminosa' little leaf phytoplasma]MDV3154180.1 FAD-dependent oxidoreductase [Pigeon pea little leaf phytoplasma]MDV3163336.1 FAD-dependent oxidoreductase [Pigeon pea little leaf phytoplasm